MLPQKERDRDKVPSRTAFFVEREREIKSHHGQRFLWKDRDRDKVPSRTALLDPLVVAFVIVIISRLSYAVHRSIYVQST